jgi:hypothetical protein
VLSVLKMQILTAALLACSCHAVTDLVGLSFDGKIYRIDPTTGVGTQVGDIGSGTKKYNCMSANAQGILHSTTLIGENLLRVNVLTPGSFTAHWLAVDGISSLAFQPGSSQWLWGATLGGGSSVFYRFDLSKPYGSQTVKTLIAQLNFLITAMEFSPAGDLFAWDPDRGLIVMDPLSGASIDVNPAVVGPSIQSIAFAPDGTCYGIYEQLFKIDITTGVATPLPSSGFEPIRGLAWYDAKCYADCEADGDLDVDDFICFQGLFAINDPAADCDTDGTLSIDDFICFQTIFAVGC